MTDGTRHNVWKGRDPDDVMDEADGEVKQKGALVRYQSRYSRRGYVALIYGTCHVCQKPHRVLAIDSSAGEYGPGMMCENCIRRCFEGRSLDGKTEQEKQMTTSIKDLFQDQRIANALARRNIHDAGDLHMHFREYCSEAAILAIPGIGRRSLRKIAAYLREEQLLTW